MFYTEDELQRLKARPKVAEVRDFLSGTVMNPFIRTMNRQELLEDLACYAQQAQDAAHKLSAYTGIESPDFSKLGSSVFVTAATLVETGKDHEGIDVTLSHVFLNRAKASEDSVKILEGMEQDCDGYQTKADKAMKALKSFSVMVQAVPLVYEMIEKPALNAI
jgi:hypothetical protein